MRDACWFVVFIDCVIAPVLRLLLARGGGCFFRYNLYFVITVLGLWIHCLGLFVDFVISVRHLFVCLFVVCFV